MILQIFSAWVSDKDPPNTVKSWLYTYTIRPLMVPHPVTTPSPEYCWSAIPKSTQRCALNMSNSSKLPSSSSNSTRSRAVSLPLACCASMRRWPPPRRAASRRVSNLVKILFILDPLCPVYTPQWPQNEVEF